MNPRATKESMKVRRSKFRNQNSTTSVTWFLAIQIFKTGQCVAMIIYRWGYNKEMCCVLLRSRQIAHHTRLKLLKLQPAPSSFCHCLSYYQDTYLWVQQLIPLGNIRTNRQHSLLSLLSSMCRHLTKFCVELFKKNKKKNQGTEFALHLKIEIYFQMPECSLPSSMYTFQILSPLFW